MIRAASGCVCEWRTDIRHLLHLCSRRPHTRTHTGTPSHSLVAIRRPEKWKAGDRRQTLPARTCILHADLPLPGVPEQQSPAHVRSPVQPTGQPHVKRPSAGAALSTAAVLAAVTSCHDGTTIAKQWLVTIPQLPPQRAPSLVSPPACRKTAFLHIPSPPAVRTPAPASQLKPPHTRWPSPADVVPCSDTCAANNIRPWPVLRSTPALPDGRGCQDLHRYPPEQSRSRHHIIPAATDASPTKRTDAEKQQRTHVLMCGLDIWCLFRSQRGHRLFP